MCRRGDPALYCQATVRQETAREVRVKTSWDSNEWLTYIEAAAFLGIRPSTLMVWICRGNRGVPYYKIGRLVRFKKRDLEEWCQSQLRGGTAACGSAL